MLKTTVIPHERQITLSIPANYVFDAPLYVTCASF
jgi:hypothetical protein